MVIPLNLAQKPTPITLIDGLIEGVRIHIKRDDLTGLYASGNKVRKLEFLLADALTSRRDMVIVAGGIQSNYVRTTLALCAKLGIKTVTLLKGKPEEPPDGNYLLDRLFAQDFRYITEEEYERVEEVMEDVAKEYRAKGYNPYILPRAGSNGLGAMGYVQMVEEVKDYIRERGIDAVFLAVGSGGTYAGALAGKMLYDIKVPFYGVLVEEDPGLPEKISSIISEISTILNKRIEVAPEDIRLILGYVGEGYGIPYPEELDIIKRLARYGIILDPVYTAKAFYGMISEKERLKFKNPLFIHTGGIFSIFSYRSYLF